MLHRPFTRRFGTADGCEHDYGQLGRHCWENALTIEELDRAYFLGAPLIDDIGARALAPAGVAKATLARQQRYTVLGNAWGQVRRGVAFRRCHWCCDCLGVILIPQRA